MQSKIYSVKSNAARAGNDMTRKPEMAKMYWNKANIRSNLKMAHKSATR